MCTHIQGRLTAANMCHSVSELFTGYIFKEGAIPASPGSCAHVAALKVIQNYSRCLISTPSLVTPALQVVRRLV